MALDAQHRSTIYQKLVPILGEEDTNRLMSEFPAAETDELVTKEHLRAGFADLRLEIADLRVEIADLRVEVRDHIDAKVNRQTVWLTSTVAAFTGIATVINLVA